MCRQCCTFRLEPFSFVSCQFWILYSVWIALLAIELYNKFFFQFFSRRIFILYAFSPPLTNSNHYHHRFYCYVDLLLHFQRKPNSCDNKIRSNEKIPNGPWSLHRHTGKLFHMFVFACDKVNFDAYLSIIQFCTKSFLSLVRTLKL